MHKSVFLLADHGPDGHKSRDVYRWELFKVDGAVGDDGADIGPHWIVKDHEGYERVARAPGRLGRDDLARNRDEAFDYFKEIAENHGLWLIGVDESVESAARRLVSSIERRGKLELDNYVPHEFLLLKAALGYAIGEPKPSNAPVMPAIAPVIAAGGAK